MSMSVSQKLSKTPVRDFFELDLGLESREPMHRVSRVSSVDLERKQARKQREVQRRSERRFTV